MLWRVTGVCPRVFAASIFYPDNGGQQSTPKHRYSCTRLHDVTYGIHRSWQSVLRKLQMSWKNILFVPDLYFSYNTQRRLPCYSLLTWMNSQPFKGFGNKFHPSEWSPKGSSLVKNEFIWKEAMLVFKTRSPHNIKTFVSSKEIFTRKS